MKKLLATLVVLALCAPAMAATMTITGVDTTTTPGSAIISWTADEGVVGISLTADCSAGQIDTVVVDSFFDVYIDSAYSIGGSYTVGQGIPTALQSGPGQLTLPAANFSISVAGLDDDGIGTGSEEAPTAGQIVLTASSATVTLAADTLRGGIVGYNGAMTLADGGLLTDIVIGGTPECVKASAAFYSVWVEYGKPACWCFQRNCRGDANGAREGNPLQGYRWVTAADLNILASGYNQLEPALKTIQDGICADFNRAREGNPLQGYRRVTSADLNVLASYYNKLEPAVPVCDQTDYNFWSN